MVQIQSTYRRLIRILKCPAKSPAQKSNTIQKNNHLSKSFSHRTPRMIMRERNKSKDKTKRRIIKTRRMRSNSTYKACILTKIVMRRRHLGRSEPATMLKAMNLILEAKLVRRLLINRLAEKSPLMTQS